MSRPSAELPPAFVLLGGFRVIARNWGYLTDLARRGLKILVITSDQWRADTLAAMNDLEGYGRLIDDARFVQGEVAIEGSFTAGVVAAVRDWLSRYELVGVMATGEMMVEQTGIVADALGLPGLGTRASRVCRSKYLQRFYLSDWSPRAVIIAPEERAAVDVSLLDFPAVLKPSGRRSSSGVQEVATAAALPTLLRQYPAAEVLLVEEYARGREYSVEALVQGGRIVFESVTHKLTSEQNSSHFVELAHTVPAPGGSAHQPLLAANRSIVERLGIGDGVVHTELRVDDSGRVVLMEIAARTPGDGIMPLYHLATGQPLEAAIVKVALGEQAIYPRPRRYARQVYLPHECGVLRDVLLRWQGVEPVWAPEGQAWPSFEPGRRDDPPTLRHVLVLKRRGQRLVALRESDDRAVTFFIDASTVEELDDIERRVRDSIDIVVDAA